MRPYRCSGPVLRGTHPQSQRLQQRHSRPPASTSTSAAAAAEPAPALILCCRAMRANSAPMPDFIFLKYASRSDHASDSTASVPDEPCDLLVDDSERSALPGAGAEWWARGGVSDALDVDDDDRACAYARERVTPGDTVGSLSSAPGRWCCCWRVRDGGRGGDIDAAERGELCSGVGPPSRGEYLPGVSGVYCSLAVRSAVVGCDADGVDTCISDTPGVVVGKRTPPAPLKGAWWCRPSCRGGDACAVDAHACARCSRAANRSENSRSATRLRAPASMPTASGDTMGGAPCPGARTGEPGRLASSALTASTPLPAARLAVPASPPPSMPRLGTGAAAAWLPQE